MDFPAPASPLPSWLPPAVNYWIAENWHDPEHIAKRSIIVGLANDPLMKRLWAELARRKRQGYVHEVDQTFLLQFFNVSAEVQIRKEEARAALEDRELGRRVAYIFLFRWLLYVVDQPGAAVTAKEAKQTIDGIKQRAEFLRIESADTYRMSKGGALADWAEIAAAMRAKADFLEGAVHVIPALQPVLSNDRSNRQGLSAAIKISQIFAALFAKPFYKFSAELATLLTCQTTTMEQVRAERPKQNPYVSFKRQME